MRRVPGTLRIVAGSLRGRRIPVPERESVRPTPDRVREALFNVLGQDLSGLTALDAFAGSGALGFEALSRGARFVTFLEADPEVLRSLRRTAESLGVADRAAFLLGRADELVRQWKGETVNLVLADPPFADAAREGFLRALVDGAVLAPAARVVVERESTSPPPAAPASLVAIRTVRYGRVALDLFADG